MIRVIKAGRRPDILFSLGSNINTDKLHHETTQNNLLYDTDSTNFNSGKNKFNFKSELYAHQKIKSTLISVQNKKCCFCESKVLHISDGDIEHFRPKKAYKQLKSDKLKRPGYYWLAYDWDNLFLACTKCNQRNKKNLFPLRDDSKRAKNHHTSIKEEEPLFIHPEFDDPEDHITFDEAFIKPKNNSDKGRTTIEELNLKRIDLIEERRIMHDLVKALIGSHQQLILSKTPNPQMSKNLISEIVKLLRRAISEEGEYTAMIRANFGYTIKGILENVSNTS